MKKLLQFLVLPFLLFSSYAIAQLPTVLGTSIVNGTYSTYNLNTVGVFKQIRLQATSTGGAGRIWEFAEGTAGSPSYTNNWRPNTGGNTISYNTFIPTSFANGARFNSGSGGASGLLPSVLLNSYYTFNVFNGSSNNEMALLLTDFNPSTLTVGSQNPVAASVAASNTVTVNVTSSATLFSGENVFLRYSTDNFITSTIVSASFTGVNGSATIPAFPAGTTVKYYFYSSTFTKATIDTNVSGNGQVVHDMSTLNISGAPQSYTVLTNPITVTATSGTLFATYATLAAAVAAINIGTHSGTITCLVPAGYSETAPAGGYSLTATGTAGNTITFIKNGAGVNPVLTAFTPQTSGNLNDSIFKLIGSDYVTIDGFTMQENVANTTTASGTNNMTEWGIALLEAAGSTINGSQNNTFQNNVISLNRLYQNSFGIYSNPNHTPTAPTTAVVLTNASGSNSFNKFYSNIISNVNYGIVVIGSNALTAVGAMDNGNDIGGTSAITGNTITNSGGIGVAVSTFALLTANNYLIFSNNQYNDNISFNNITSAIGTSALTNGGILKNYSSGATVQPSGTITTTINNNTITVANNPTAAGSGAIVGINNLGLSPLLSTATISINNNTVQNCVLGGSISTINGITGITNSSVPGMLNMNGNNVTNNSITATSATAGGITTIANSGASTTVNINGNLIANNGVTAATATTTIIVGITSSVAVGTLNITGNTLRNFTSSATTTGQVQGIINTGAVVTAINITGNFLGNATGGFATMTAANTGGGLFGIYNAAAASTCALTITGNDIRGITYNVTTTNAFNTYITTITGLPLTNSISNNTFTNLNVSTSGSITFINHGYSIPATAQLLINNNSIVTAFTRTVAGSITLTTTNSTSGTGSINNYTNNNFSNIFVPDNASSSIVGFNNTDGGTGSTKTITGNTFSNWNGGIAGTTGTTGPIACMNFTYWNGISSLSNNTISNITGRAAITGVTIGSSSNAASSIAVANNFITGLNSIGTGGQVIGISCSNTSSVININSNTINSLATSGASTATSAILITNATTTNVFQNTINGITASGATSPFALGISIQGGTTLNVYRNKIHGISATASISTSTPAVIGINITAGTTVNTYNNIIGDLTAPLASLTDAIRGISLVSTVVSSNYKIHNNSIYITGTSSGTNFGSTGIYHTGNSTSTTAALDLRNNIVVNISTPTGTGVATALRRSGAALLGNFSTNSNRNSLYAGTPSATHTLMFDGTNAYQTMASYQTAVAPSREVSSFSEGSFNYAITTPGGFFSSITPTDATYLQPLSGITTQSESGGLSTGIFTDDYSGAVRPVSPGTNFDCGAWEFNGVNAAAVIVLNSVAPTTTAQCLKANRVVTVTVTNSGAATTTTVVLNYSHNGTAQTPINMTNTSGNIWTGTMLAPTVGNATVTWNVVATNTNSVSATYVGTSFADEPISPIVVSPTTATLCTGTIQALTATGGNYTNATILSENFNGTAPGWTQINNTTTTGAGNPALAAWSFYNPGATFYSNDNSVMIGSNFDAVGSGCVGNTEFYSPVFSLVGASSANLNFYQYYLFNGTAGESAKVQITINGTLWTDLVTYTSTQGAPTAFLNTNLALTPYVGNPNVQLRFKYVGGWDFYWFIDNLKVTATGQPIIWSPATGLYTDAAATTPYTGTIATTVYAKPTTSQTYTATSTFGSCTRTATSVLTVDQLAVGGAVTGTQTWCLGKKPTDLTVSGYTGTILKWQYDTTVGFALPTDISSTAITLPAALAQPAATTALYYRAVITNGSCPTVFSTPQLVQAVAGANLATYTAGAWNPSSPMASNTTIVFDDNYAPTVPVTLKGCDCTVNSGKTVTIPTGSTLELLNELNVDATSTMTFYNDAPLLQTNSTYPNVGKIIVNRNSSSLMRLDYTLWSSPVSSLLSLKSFSTNTVNNRFYTYTPLTNTYSTIDPTSNIFSIGKGYLIRMPDNHPTSPSIWSGQFNGIPVNGSISVPISDAGPVLTPLFQGFNVIGNPYPSQVNINQFLTANSANIESSLYFWRKTNESSPGPILFSGYCTYTGGILSQGSSFTNGIDPLGVLQIGQGFMVKAKAGQSSVTFNNGMRILDTANQFFKTTSTPEVKNTFWLNLMTSTGGYAQMASSYREVATMGVDINDGFNLNDGQLSVGSLIDNKNYIIQSRTLPFDVTDVMPLVFKTNVDGNYTFAIDHVDGLFTAGAQPIYLRDTVLNTVTNLNTGNYTFATTAGTVDNRFEIIYQNVLATPTNTLNENALVVYKNSGDIVVNSGNVIMSNVKIVDMRGRLLLDKNNINGTEVRLNIGATNQVVLVKTTLAEGQVITKKVIN